MAYTEHNFRTKKALMEALARGETLRVLDVVWSGEVSVEGPWYPEPHRWYARVTLKEGVIVKVQ